MTAKVTKVLEDFHTITPHLTVRGVAEAVKFYAERSGPPSSIATWLPTASRSCTSSSCSVIRASSSTTSSPSTAKLSPLGGQATGVKLHLYVEDVDDMYQQAVEAGATVLMPLQDCFWGDRYAILVDPFGHRWSMATRIEDLSPRQLKKRASEFKRSIPPGPKMPQH